MHFTVVYLTYYTYAGSRTNVTPDKYLYIVVTIIAIKIKFAFVYIATGVLIFFNIIYAYSLYTPRVIPVPMRAYNIYEQ